MKNIAIARRYAKALLLIGKEDGQTATYREELGGFTALLADQPDLARALTNPLYNTADRRKVLNAVLQRLNLSRVVTAFLTLLFDKGRFGFVDAINERFQHLADELKGIARATLVTATDLTDETVGKIRAALSQRTGRQVEMAVEVDPGLIGGIVTRIGDLVLDGSVRTQLANMRETLKKG